MVGRIDLKNDRQNHVLRVQSAWLEPDAPADVDADVELRVVPLLEQIRAWQGLDSIAVVDRGNFAAALRGALGR